eukprot:scaffold47474_cov55-Phaeocystis_antarctica.AAC.2
MHQCTTVIAATLHIPTGRDPTHCRYAAGARDAELLLATGGAPRERRRLARGSRRGRVPPAGLCPRAHERGAGGAAQLHAAAHAARAQHGGAALVAAERAPGATHLRPRAVEHRHRAAARPLHGGRGSMVKVTPWQCPSSARVPPQGTLDGSGQLGTPRKRPAPERPATARAGRLQSRRCRRL